MNTTKVDRLQKALSPLRNDHVQAINVLLQERLPSLTTIYLFGYRRMKQTVISLNKKQSKTDYAYFYDLLIIAEKASNHQLEHLQADIFERLDISVFLLASTSEEAQEALNNNSPFFHKTLQLDKALFLRDNSPPKWLLHANNGIQTEEERKVALTRFFDRINTANGLYSGGYEIQHSEQVAVKALLYSQAIEQACLGLLTYFYNYNPRQPNFKSLYQLCSSFWSFPRDIFPQNTKEEKKMFKEFSEVIDDIYDNAYSEINWDNIYRYDERCKRFLSACNKLIQI